MADVKVKLKSSGMRGLLKSNDVKNSLMSRAERVLAAAQADPHDDTFEYEHSLHIESAITDRVVLRVVSNDRKAFILEAKYGILSRALDAGR